MTEELQGAMALGSRLAQAVATLQETVTESRRIAARSRAILASVQARANARFCQCGSADVYTTLITSMATYRRCQSCGNVWACNAVGQHDDSSGL